MSQWRKGSQKERRKQLKLQAAVPHPLRVVPPLPSTFSTYNAVCTSRNYHHDCSVHCESEITSVASTTRYFYVIDKHRYPVELWEQKDTFGIRSRDYNLKWRHPDYNPKFQHNAGDYHPYPPPGGGISEDKFIAPFTQPEPKRKQQWNLIDLTSPDDSDVIHHEPSTSRITTRVGDTTGVKVESD